MSSYTRSDLISHLASNNEMSQFQANHVLSAILSGVQGGLTGDGKVSLVGFGTFQVRHRAARTGRNPQTREPIEIPASNGVGFKPGQSLRDAVNG